VAPVRERAVPLDAVAMAAQHEAVAPVVRRLGAEEREALTREREAIGGVVRRDHVGEARDCPVHGLDAGREAAHAARAGDGEPARAAAHHLDADAAAAAGEHVAAEREPGSRCARGHGDQEPAAGADAARDRIVGAERARADQASPQSHGTARPPTSSPQRRGPAAAAAATRRAPQTRPGRRALMVAPRGATGVPGAVIGRRGKGRGRAEPAAMPCGALKLALLH